LDSYNKPIYKLLKDPISLISIIVIGIFLFLSIGAYLISPDKTPYANEQHLEISVKKPGFSVEMLCFKNLNQSKKKFFERLIYGQPSEYIATPIFKHWKQGDKLFVETYTGDTPNNGEIICVNPETDYKI
jgi:peptide/nickel transport system permease protein